MSSHIYIAGAFKNVTRSKCNPDKEEIDNDPHFWTDPPTWGVCRTDFRNTTKEGDYVFFVLPLASKLHQTIFGYMKVKEVITHERAFKRPELKSKRMARKRINGNIIVNSRGSYNKFDNEYHRDRFHKIKERYLVGDIKDSAFLTEKQIEESSKTFLTTLCNVFNAQGNKVYEIIGRKGRVLLIGQAEQLQEWLSGYLK